MGTWTGENFFHFRIQVNLVWILIPGGLQERSRSKSQEFVFAMCVASSKKLSHHLADKGFIITRGWLCKIVWTNSTGHSQTYWALRVMAKNRKLATACLRAHNTTDQGMSGERCIQSNIDCCVAVKFIIATYLMWPDTLHVGTCTHVHTHKLCGG